MRTRRIMLAATLAAIYFVLRSIPTFQMVGISGQFTAADFLLTSIALLGGLWAGTVSVLIGTILAYGVRSPVFLGLDFLPAVVNVAISSLLLSKRYRVAQVVYTVIFLAFVLSPYSLLFAYDGIPYVWLHIVALVVIFSPISARIPAWVNGTRGKRLGGIALLAFLGTMGQHLAGGLLYEFVVGIIGGISPSKFMAFWRIIFWVYPVERVLTIAISTLIALAVQRSVSRLAGK